MNLLTKVWEDNADLRFFQLLINLGVISDDNILYDKEDDEIEDYLNGIFGEK